MKHIIYKIINKINGKFYIGKHSTNNLDDGYLGSGILIKKAIIKYGASNFLKEILFVYDNEEDALNKERELVTEKIVKDINCYNLTLGGRGSFYHCQSDEIIAKRAKSKSGRKLTEEHKLKISKSIKKLKLKHSDEFKDKLRKRMAGENNPMYGKEVPQETKDKISKAGMGRIPSNETRQKISESKRGKIVSEETRRKISESKKGRRDSDETRKRKSESHKGKIVSEETRRKISNIHKGKIVSEETRKKFSNIAKDRIGNKNPNYKEVPPICLKIMSDNKEKSLSFIKKELEKIGVSYSLGKIKREFLSNKYFKENY